MGEHRWSGDVLRGPLRAGRVTLSRSIVRVGGRWRVVPPSGAARVLLRVTHGLPTAGIP